MKKNIKNRLMAHWSGNAVLTLSLLAGLIPAVSSTGKAATVTWGTSTTISTEADVVNPGTLAYAYAFSNTATTLNGVAFTGTNSFGTIATNITLSGFTANNTTSFGAAGTAYNAIGTSYQNVIKGASYGGSSAGTVTLNNLTVGRKYAVQYWVNDSRAGSGGTAQRKQTLATGVELFHYAGGTTTSAAGGVGQFAVGTFTADATTQALTITPGGTSPSVQINAIQVRDITGITGTSGSWNVTTNNATWSTTSNWLNSTVATGEGFHANFNNLDPTADTTVRLDSARTIGSLTFGDTTASSAASWILDNNGSSSNVLTLAGSSPSITVNTLGTSKMATISADIAGSAGFTKRGAGILNLSGAKSFTGGVNLAAGILRIDNNAALGDSSNTLTISAASTTLRAGANLTAVPYNMSFGANAPTFDTNTFNMTLSGVLSGSGAITKSSTGTLTLSGANTFSGGVTVSAGKIVLANTAALGALPANSLTVNSIAIGNNTAEIMTDASLNAYNIGLGSDTASPGSTYIINRATSGAAVDHNLGALLMGRSSTMMFTTASTGNNITSGTPRVSFNSMNLGSGVGGGQSTITPTGVNLSITGNVGNFSGNNNVDKGVTLSGTSTGNLISGVISNGTNAGTGKLALIKNSTSTWTLTAANTYTGATTINAGTLALGTGGSISASPTITVATGATLDATAAGMTLASGQTLQGAGSVTGSVTTSSGSTIAPGGNVVGTLSIASLNLSSGTTVNWEYGTGSDLVNVTDTNGLAINGGAVNLYQVGTTTAFTTNGTYNLFQFSGSLGGVGASGLSVANPQAGKVYEFGVSGNYVTVTISDAPTPNYWAQDLDGSWATGSSWTLGSAPNGANAIANLGGVGSPTLNGARVVTLDGDQTAGSVNFNSALGFTINVGTGGSLLLNNGSAASLISATAGTNVVNTPVVLNSGGVQASAAAGTSLSFNGAISGSGAVAASGAGSIVLAASNTYSGSTTIGSGATVSIGSGSTDGSFGSGAVVNSGTLVLNRSNDFTVSNVISGSGVLNVNGSGAATLSATNTFTGLTTVNSGVLVLSGGAAIADASSVVLANAAGATLRLASNETIATLTGGGTTGGNVDLQANTLTLSSATNATFAGAITGSGSIAKANSNTLTFSGTSDYSGSTTMSGGILTAASDLAFGSSTVVINAGSQRLVVNDGQTITNPITINGGGVTTRGLIENSGTGTATISGPITINSTVAAGGHFASFSTGTLVVNSAITSSVIVTARLGTMVFAGGGSYNNFLINQGTVKLGANNGLSTSATVENAASGASFLDLNGFNQSLAGITRTSGNVATIGNSSTTSDSTLTLTGTSIYPGLIVDTISPGTRKVALEVSGGTLTLSNTNTFTGGTTVKNNGTINISAGGALSSGLVTIESGSTLNTTTNVTCTFKPAGAGTLNFAGLGTGATATILNVDNTGFTGTMNVGTTVAAGAGKVQLNSPVASAATVNVATNATLYVSTAITQPAAITLNGGDTGESLGQLRLEGGATWSGSVTLAGNITGTGDATFGCNTGAGTISGAISETGGSRALSKIGAGTLTLSGANSYTGATSVLGGYLRVANAAALGTSAGGVTLTSGASLVLANGITVTDETVTVNGFGGNARGALQADSAASATWAGPVLLGTGDSRVGAQANGELIITGKISNGAGNSLITSADVSGGKVVVSNTANDYTGQTQVIRGVLQLGATNALPVGTVLNVHSATGVPDAAQVNLAGFNQEVAGLLRGNNSGAASVTNAEATTSSLTINVPTATSYTFDSIVSGNVALVKSGAGTQLLTAVNTYSGTTAVNAGVLTINGDQTGATGAVSVSGSGTLNGTGTIGGAIAVASGGSIAPGSGSTIGNLTAASGVSFEAGATFAAQINTTASTADKLIVNGNLTLANATLSLSDLGAGTLATSTVFTIATYTGSLSGTFNGLAEGAVVQVNGVNYAIKYADGGNNITLSLSTGGFDSWAAEKGLTGADALQLADPDQDGISNLLEYVLNGEPKSASVTILPTLDASGDNFVFTFFRKSASKDDTTQVFQYNSDLSSTWTNVTIPASTSGNVAITADTPSSGIDRVVVTLPKNGATTVFGRLNVTK